MKLYIDTTNSDKIKIGIDKQIFEADSKKEKSQILLPFLEQILKKEGKSLKDITEIEINTGPGSYTGIRVGASIAQALGWTLNVPVNGKNIAKGEHIEIKY